MKPTILGFLKKVAASVAPFQKLVLISLAAWVTHILLRVLLLFRSNPYGFPFVSKPDWFIFHAVCIDFMWIMNALVVFLILGGIVYRITAAKATAKAIVVKIATVLYAVFHTAILLLTLLDNETQRFLGGHLTFGLVDTYKDTSSIIVFYDYVANDLSVPYLQFVVLALMLPLTYIVYRLLCKWYRPDDGFYVKKSAIAMLIFYIASYLFVYFIWTGNARMTKLRPVVSLIYNDLFVAKKTVGLTDADLGNYRAAYQNLWQKIEGDSDWEFSDAKEGNGLPLYRVPSASLLNSEKLKAQRAMQPNFILVLMESQRGRNTGYMNPQIQPSPTPFMDSLAAHSHVWMRMHTSGVPTTGGVLSTHIGIPHHSRLAQATDLAHVTLPSFVQVLTENGYSTHYMSAADPAWDNLGVWMSKWYTTEHYNREREDDSTFIDNAIEYVRDTLSKEGKPFLATLMTRSNHYPFNFAAGMTDEQKNRPLQERINVTMNYADRQIARFFHSIENEEWYKNTYVIIMADHGFPLGENGVSTMNGGGFSNVSWIPFFIHGKGLDAVRDTTTAAQIDIAPTVLELAGFAVPNIFMGHNLLRGNVTKADSVTNDSAAIDSTIAPQAPQVLAGLSLGAYSGYAAIGLDGYRFIAKYPAQDETHIFADSDLRQENELTGKQQNEEGRLSATLDTLLKISDYSLEKGL
ncbi:LTA synthase family protein [Fibrobacter succinogenes]|uniref:LTA synthase family protein n=1 Tax=Fibrobacter succinogenes TaxID=833 RepID=UPI0013D0AA0A|nr:alkaline phosphatase family protein [Fibrobacter succinogenes]